MPRKARPAPPPKPSTLGRNEPLSLDEVDTLRETFGRVGTRAGTAKALGMSRTTVNRYLDFGDPKRGIPAILGGVAPASQVSAPLGAPTAAASASGEATPRLTPSPSPGEAPGGLGGPPGGKARPPAPPSPPPLPSPLPPGASQGMPQALQPAPPTGGNGEIGHTVPIANAELTRLSRNMRNLLNMKMRITSKMADRLQKADPAGKGGRLTASERDLLMVVREMRVTAFDVEKLYGREVAILGVNSDAGKQQVPAEDPSALGLGEEDTATIDELRRQLEELTLGGSVNLGAARGRK